MRRFFIALGATVFAGCSDSATPTIATDVRPSFSASAGCDGHNQGEAFCDAAREAIDNLMNHSNPQCQWLGQQADMRFNDPHEGNAIEYNESAGTFLAYPSADQHEEAPEHTGSTFANSWDAMPQFQQEIAGGEAQAYGSSAPNCT